jgi:hypothetical protein
MNLQTELHESGESLGVVYVVFLEDEKGLGISEIFQDEGTAIGYTKEIQRRVPHYKYCVVPFGVWPKGSKILFRERN